MPAPLAAARCPGRWVAQPRSPPGWLRGKQLARAQGASGFWTLPSAQDANERDWNKHSLEPLDTLVLAILEDVGTDPSACASLAQ